MSILYFPDSNDKCADQTVRMHRMVCAFVVRMQQNHANIYSFYNKALAYLLLVYAPLHDMSNNVGYATSKGSDQSAHKRSLIRASGSRLSIL